MEPLCRPQAHRLSLVELPSDIKENWHDVGREMYCAYPVGTVEHGFNPNWYFAQYNPAGRSRREITRPRRRFWYHPGEYVVVAYESQKIPVGDVFLCGSDGVRLLGTARRGSSEDVADIVIGHHDPEAMKLRMLRRQDEIRFMAPAKIFTTKRGGPLEGLQPGQRFAFSWGLGATIEKIGPRVVYFRPDHTYESDPVDRQLSSVETRDVTRDR